MPRVGDFDEGYRASEFVFVIDGTESPGVSKVSGLSEGELDTIEQPDGATGHVYKLAAAKVKFEPLTIERRVDGSREDNRFREWFRQTFQLNALQQGGSSVRKNGMVIKRHFGEDVLRFAFYGAWVKSSKFTDLEAGSTNLLLQTIVLEHEGLERV
ncbi:phage tail protein [Amycolatopsis sp. NPDC024027]|uniref:phage tail protein n=1 Tax=Amycolatopsis sp. NPDC024027 TaxID=3154327 RepID=UPI0033FCD1DB